MAPRFHPLGDQAAHPGIQRCLAVLRAGDADEGQDAGTVERPKLVLSREAKVKADHLRSGFEQDGKQGVVFLKGNVGRRQGFRRRSIPILKGPFEVLNPGLLLALIPGWGPVAEPVGMEAPGPKGARLGKLSFGPFGRARPQAQGPKAAGAGHGGGEGGGAHARHGGLENGVGKAEGGEGRMHGQGLSSGFLYSCGRVP